MVINKKNTIIASAVIIVLAGTAYFLLSSQADQADKPPATVENNYVEDEQQGLINEPSPTTDGTDEKVLTPTVPENSDANLEKPNITRAEVNGDTIRVSALFTAPSDGICELVLEKAGSEPIAKTAPIIVGPSYYTCNGFRVPVSELPSRGEWTLKVIHKKNNSSVSSDTKSIEVE